MSLLDRIRQQFRTPARRVDLAAVQSLVKPPSQPPLTPSDGIEINPEFRAALDAVLSGAPLVFVTGSAGTGKSTWIDVLQRSTRKNLAIVAPTGVAALNVKGQTVHSFCKSRFLYSEEMKRARDRRLYEKLDILVIDEVSMVRADGLDAVDRFLRLNREKPNQLFGGVQIVMVGDLFQLPPIVERQEEARFLGSRYSSPFFFSANTLQEGSLISVELTRVYRQRDPRFIDLLQRIREGRDVATAVAELNAACVSRKLVRPAIILTPTNRAAGEINQAELNKLSGPTCTFTGSITGEFKVQKERLPAPYTLEVRLGAQVMFTKNDVSKRWVNGTVGTLQAIRDKSMRVETASGTFEVERVTWDSYEYIYDEGEQRVRARVIGSYEQFPLMLAWAITIHKSQGLTLSDVIVDLDRGAFAEGQAYVALSRCRSLDGLSLARPVRERDVISSDLVRRFYALVRGSVETTTDAIAKEPG